MQYSKCAIGSVKVSYSKLVKSYYNKTYYKGVFVTQNISKIY